MYLKYVATKQKRFDIYDSNKDDIVDNVSSKSMKMYIAIMLVISLVFVSIITYKIFIQKIVIEVTGYTKEVCGMDIIFDVEGDYDVYKSSLEYNLQQVPDYIKEKLQKDKWKIYITNEEMAEEGVYWGLQDKSDILGATSLIHKYIIIPNNTRSIDMSVIHEIGHYIDNFQYTYSDEWESIFYEERMNYSREYAKTTKTEAFACEFMEYIQTPEELKVKAPKTYNFIDSIVNNLKTS